MAKRTSPQQRYQKAIKEMSAESKCFGVGVTAGIAKVHMDEAIRSYKTSPGRAMKSLQKVAGAMGESQDINSATAKEAEKIASRIKKVMPDVVKKGKKANGVGKELRSIADDLSSFTIKRWRRCGLPETLKENVKL